MSAESGFRWTKQTERAAQLVAEDKQTDTEIAAEVGVVQRTLERWKQHPTFQQKVAEIVEAYRQSVLTQGIADRVKRVSALNDRWNRMQQVVEERAVDEQMQHVPGGKTGLMVHQVKAVGRGEDFQLIDLYIVDDGLLSEMRATEKQAAQELGQWEEKSSVRTEGSVAVKVLKGVSMDDL
jgi:hypothetical protein